MDWPRSSLPDAVGNCATNKDTRSPYSLPKTHLLAATAHTVAASYTPWGLGSGAAATAAERARGGQQQRRRGAWEVGERKAEVVAERRRGGRWQRRRRREWGRD
ncbi:hypothetical protein GUJ93_ZPchr0006g41190 [Zizania palustris]|uniref:Uncharacterized protein n=1 Tax=Zizania palustris TaxID=103762 RepID=A0A8J5SEJ0_ZIZPA|nr:hypothetical protein GUJ93_ZPchr0006g41190 [Zizania palustris]